MPVHKPNFTSKNGLKMYKNRFYRHVKFKNFLGRLPPNPPYERGYDPLSCSPPPPRAFGPRGTSTAFNGRTTFQKPTTALKLRERLRTLLVLTIDQIVVVFLQKQIKKSLLMCIRIALVKRFFIHIHKLFYGEISKLSLFVILNPTLDFPHFYDKYAKCVSGVTYVRRCFRDVNDP